MMGGLQSYCQESYMSNLESFVYTSKEDASSFKYSSPVSEISETYKKASSTLYKRKDSVNMKNLFISEFKDAASERISFSKDEFKAMKFQQRAVYNALENLDLKENYFNNIIGLKPTISSLDSFVSYIGDQGSIYSCSGWAVAGLKSIERNLVCKKVFKEPVKDDKKSFFSPSYLYYKAKKVNQISNECNVGINLFAVLNVAYTYGVPELIYCDYFKNPFNCSVNDEADSVVKNAQQYRVSSSTPIEATRCNFQYYLSHGSPIAVTLQIDNAFLTDGNKKIWTKDWPFIWSGYGSSKKKGERKPHSVICIGYNDNIGAFLFVDSHGRSFGNNGMFWVSYDFLFKTITEPAFILNNSMFETYHKQDLEKIDQLSQISNTRFTDNQIKLIEKGPSKQLLGLGWTCLSIDTTENREMVVLMINNGKDTIRKSVCLTYGICSYFTNSRYIYFIKLDSIDLEKHFIGKDELIASLRIGRISKN